MNPRSIVLAIALVAVGLAFTPESLQAQCDGAYCNYNGQSSTHFFLAAPTCTTGDGFGCKDCSSAPEGHIGCHAPGKPGECSTHASCDVAHHDEEALLLAAVKSGHFTQIAAVLATSKSFKLNAQRQAIQGRNCRGVLITHIPVPTTVLNATSLAMAEQRNIAAAFRVTPPVSDARTPKR